MGNGFAGSSGSQRKEPLRRGRRRPAVLHGVSRLILMGATLSPIIVAQAEAPAPIAAKAVVPAGLAAGTTTTVKLEGDLPRWPLAVWSDRVGLSWKPLEEKGTFEVTAAAEAIGVYRIRFHDSGGATGVRRFVVGRERELIETEPDDLPRQAQPLGTMPVTVNGVLAKTGDADCFSLDLQRGATLVATLDANRGPGSPVDAVLDLVDERGGYRVRTLDARGLDPRIVFTAERSGPVVIRVWGFPSEPSSTIELAGGPDYVYRLTVTAGPCLAGTLPSALARDAATALMPSGWNLPESLEPLIVPAADDRPPGDIEEAGPVAGRWIAFPGICGAVELPIVDGRVLSGGMATDGEVEAVEPPFVATGRFDQAGVERAWRVKAKKGDSLAIAVVGNAEGYEADTLFEIRDSSGTRLLSNTDREPAIVWKPPTDDTFVFALRERRGRAGPAHLVRLSVAAESSTVVLASTVDAVSLVVGGKAELPITVGRLGGFKEAFEVRLVDPPEAITAAVVTSAADGESSKKVTLVLEAKAPFSGPVRVTGAGMPVTFGRERLTSLWITVPAPPTAP